MIITKYEEANKQEWNNFVNHAKNSHFIFNRDFMEYHSSRFSDFSLIIKKDNKIIALLPANLSNNTIYSHQGLTFGGFIIDSNMRMSIMIEIFEELKKFLHANFSHIQKIIFKSIPYIYHQSPCDEELYALFLNNAILIRRDVSTAILKSDPLKYSSLRSRQIKKAKTNLITIQELSTPSEIWKLVREVLSSHHNASPVHNENEIDNLQKKFPNNIKQYGAFFKDDLVAGVITFETESVCHTQYLASSNQAREIGGLDYLIDYLIANSNKKYFDFGTSNEKNGTILNYGLINQKEGFGARAVVHDFYELNIYPS